MIRALRLAWIFAAGIAVTLWISGAVVVVATLRPSRLQSYGYRAPRIWSRVILKLAGVRARLENLERLGSGRAQVAIANHQSWFDVFALCASLPVDYVFVGKKELARIPVFGRAWILAGHFAIDRSDRKAAIESLKAMVRQVVERGHTVVMFPEGTRSPDGRLQPFKKGAFRLALEAQIPLVPIGIAGTRQVMPKGGWAINGGEVRVRTGIPIPTKGLTAEDRFELIKRAENAVRALMDPADAQLGKLDAPERADV